MPQLRILLVQLASFGDCLLVTPIAKQIKEIDYPGCRLTWMIGSKYKSVLKNNPFVDEIIEISLSSEMEIQVQRDLIDEHVSLVGGYKVFNEIFITDYTLKNFKNWYGTTRSSLFRNYPHRLKINPQPLIYLDTQEINNVSAFCKEKKINGETFNILFECYPLSKQSSMTFEKAQEIAEQLTSDNHYIKFILSSKQATTSDNPNIIDGSEISWRENAELIKYCDMLVGCSSGISWLCTSNFAKHIPNIQVLNSNFADGNWSASMKNDFMYFGLETNDIIELYDSTDKILKECILTTVEKNFKTAKAKFDMSNNECFSNYRFLKESNISNYRKALLFMHYYLENKLWNNFLKKYKRNKPNWLTPKVWFQKIIKIYNTYLLSQKN